jgi:hypothetical protein
MATETNNKVQAATRYSGVYASGALTIFMTLGSFDPDQQQKILASIHTMYTSLHDFIGAASNLWYIIFPVIAIWLAKIGVSSSGFGSMMDRIFQAAQAGDRQARLTILNAAASPSLGTQGIVNKSLAPDPSTAANIVASAQEVPHA